MFVILPHRYIKLGTKLKYSTTCPTQTDGKTEVTNRTLGVLLRTLIKSNLKSWDQLLAHSEFAYNKTLSKTTGMSPFKVVYVMESPLTNMRKKVQQVNQGPLQTPKSKQWLK